jgi:hypothetical protein
MRSKPLAKLLLVLAGLLDLGEHPSLESTVWKKDGSVLVVAAHTRFTGPLQAGGHPGLHRVAHAAAARPGAGAADGRRLLVRGSRRACHPAH